jgi:hypothetical protein
MTGGTSGAAFALPPAFRPAAIVVVPLDLCSANNGALQITPDGTVVVVAEGNFSNAQCLTSLDGVSYSLTGSGSQLNLINGWTGAPLGTFFPSVRTISGIVHITGTMNNGTSSVAFVVPKASRPARFVEVPVELCGPVYGQLTIGPDGEVSVEAEGGNFGQAQCRTFLDGVSYAP